MRKKNGFTLVELLSTVVILGVVLSVTVYIVMKNINKAKDNAELITYNNIKSAAKVYNDEVASYWNIKDDYEYSCISLGNMIEIGYFDENTINKSDKLSKDTMLKVIRDKDSKVIKETSFSFEDSILPDVDCGFQSSISISTDNKGKKVKTTNTKILYNGLNDSYYRYFYISEFDENTVTTNDVVYSCEGIGNCSNDIVNNLESGHWYLTNSDLVRLSVKSNGTISAFINYNSENVAEAIKNIDFIDNTPPVISLSVNKIGSYNGNTPSTKGELITNTNGDYVDSEWKNYGYWFDISTNEDSVIKWSYNDTNKTNGDSPSKNGANCNTTCSKTLSGDGNRKATITATDEAGNSSKIEVNIYIDRTAPTISVSEQRCSNKDNCLGSLIGNKIEKSTNTRTNIDDKTWTYNGINISYNATDSMSGFKEIRVLQNNSGIYDSLSTDMISNDIVNNNGNTIISDTGQRYIQVIAYDNVGNSSVVNITGYISNITTVSYNANGGSGSMEPTTAIYGNTTSIKSNTFTRTGYTFVGWTTRSDGADDGFNWTNWAGTWLYNNGQYGISDGKLNLYARWQANTYTISYNLNGGSYGSSHPTSGVYGSTVTVSNPSRTGYTFTGWSVSGTGASMSETSLIIGADNITLTANWEANYYYLDLNGMLDGSSSGGISGYGTADVYINGTLVCNDCTDYYTAHPYGTTYSISDIKTTTGHRYNGVYSGSASGTITGNTSVYLSYSTNTYYITYDANGGTGAPGTQAFLYNSGSTISSIIPTRYGYTFLYWTYSGNIFNPGAAIPTGWGSFTLTANWKANDTTPPTCSLSASGSNITASASDNIGIAYQGWSSSYSGGNEYSKGISVGTHTYYVKDTAGNTNVCSISISGLIEKDIPYTETSAAYANYGYKASGQCTCRSKNKFNGSYKTTIVGCVVSGSSAVCSCSGSTPIVTSNGCSVSKYVTSYYCPGNGTVSGSTCIYTKYKITYVCPDGYSGVSGNSNYCYKK